MRSSFRLTSQKSDVFLPVMTSLRGLLCPRHLARHAGRLPFHPEASVDLETSLRKGACSIREVGRCRITFLLFLASP